MSSSTKKVGHTGLLMTGLITGLAAVLLADCNAFPTQENYRKIVEHWMGHHANELVHRWGQPA